MEQLKKCIKCGVELPLSAFVGAIGRLNGVRGICKACNALYQRKWREHHPAERCDPNDGKDRNCGKCGRLLPSGDFYFRKDSGKRQSLCKSCYEERQKSWRDRRKIAATVPKSPTSKTCHRCGLVKPASAFGPNRIALDGLRTECKECRNKQERTTYAKKPGLDKARQLRYRERHPGRIAALSKARYANHVATDPDGTRAKGRLRAERRRARKAEAVDNLKHNEAEQILQMHCFLCGDREKLELAHDIPVALGGNTTKANIICLCRKCNAQMSTHTLAELIGQLELMPS